MYIKHQQRKSSSIETDNPAEHLTVRRDFFMSLHQKGPENFCFFCNLKFHNT